MDNGSDFQAAYAGGTALQPVLLPLVQTLHPLAHNLMQQPTQAAKPSECWNFHFSTLFAAGPFF